MSIRGRLLGTYLALTGTGMLVLAVTTLVSFQRYFLASVRADLAARATAVSESVADWLEQDNLTRVAVIVARYGAQEDVTVRVFSPAGVLLASSEPDDPAGRVPVAQVPGVTAALAGRRAQGDSHGGVDSGERHYQAVPVSRQGRLLGAMRMSRKLDRFEAQMRRATLTVAGLLLAVFAAATLASLQLAYQLAEPIRKMRDFALALARGRFGLRLDIRRRDELGQLASALEHMGEQLAALERERRAFLASASHELRTPVSNVKVTLEALESGAAEDAQLRDRFLRTAVDETNRMAGLIQDLLDLGRLEAGVSPLDRQATDVRHLMERLARTFEPRLRDAGLELAVEAVDAPVSVDTERLLQALFNLLDNAIKFAPAGSTIAVRTFVAGKVVNISIADEGPGIAAADLPRVFDQFFSADPARQRGGTGLGLAIAKKIIDGHGGTLTVSSEPGKGATFVITLPLRRVDPAAA
jgi:signal transduction histidine kinase